MTTLRKTRQNMRSTDRAGVFNVSLGVLVLSLGLGLFVGASMQASHDSIRLFKQMAMGLSGKLFFVLPFFCVWFGVLCLVSAKRHVSYRGFLVSFALFLTLLAFLTMITFVPGYGTLTDYTLTITKGLAGENAPGSMSSFIRCAYRQYNGLLTPLPGGGALGMLLAYPLWTVFGGVATAVVLAVMLIVLSLMLIRVNPIALFLYRSDSAPKQPIPQRRAVVSDPGPAQPYIVNAPAAMPTAVASQSAPDHGTVPQQTVQEAFVYHETPQYVDPYEIASSTDAVDGTFVQVPSEMGMLFAQVGEETSAVQQNRSVYSGGGESAEPANLSNHAPAVPSAPKPQIPLQERETTMGSYEKEKAAAQHPVLPKQDTEKIIPLRNFPAEATDADEPPFDEDISSEETTPVVPVKPAVPINQTLQRPREAKPVHMDPAVPLTGERISVKPAFTPQQAIGLDGMARQKNKQIEIPVEAYEKPPLRLLSSAPEEVQQDYTEADQRRAEKLLKTLNSFSIPADVQEIVHGPAITRFAIRLGEGVNVNRLRNIMDNLSVELLAKSPVRAEIPIPGTPLIGLEVSNDVTSTVYLKDVLHSPRMLEKKSPTVVALGKDITGTPIACELMDMPHLLIAGATGSGKSVCINSIITSLLYRATPRDVRLILVDPKFVELQPYNGCPHLLLPVITDDKKVVAALEWLCEEMDDRYQKMQKYNVRNIDGYNRKISFDEEPLPKIIMIIDEMADLIATCGKVVEEHIKRITAKARAAGICLILATQRPSVNVITGVIKANIPSRIAFQVSSQVDSRTILDAIGAERLLGYGDMLYLPRNYSAPKRVQGCYICDKDVEIITEYVKSRNQAEYNVDLIEHIEEADKKGDQASTNFEEGEVFDELLPQAIEIAVEAGQISISMLQRVLRVGYGRAGRLIDEMERRGVIGQNEGTKPRKTLLEREEYQRMVDNEDPRLT